MSGYLKFELGEQILKTIRPGYPGYYEQSWLLNFVNKPVVSNRLRQEFTNNTPFYLSGFLSL